MGADDNQLFQNIRRRKIGHDLQDIIEFGSPLFHAILTLQNTCLANRKIYLDIQEQDRFANQDQAVGFAQLFVQRSGRQKQ